MTDDAPSSPYLRALERARALGRADGLLEAAAGPAGEAVLLGACCHGRGPDGLALLVWDGAGSAPAGVRLNAPAWYADGFRGALAEAERNRRRVPRPRPPSD
ncbi:hypothetical protein SAMN04488107_1914 [Geodermatophilus saharensis]|uniref:Uncharacterized protein n=1 Tax=Geodermatophilus saharensis TaxID=1137994 RepID=A0A239CZ54_9ACTN|nr:hypothetical protein [Geodermatophilus saharensis]SNS25505.1 hypothetical protein SAMN04488107_1914 [Geodermatophilus saharensis]